MKGSGFVSRLVRGRPKELLASLALVLLVAVLYGRAVTFDFVAVDDVSYVKDNIMVKQGLTLRGIEWAFTSAYAANWHPVTWISHMADMQLYDLRPGMHHLTNVILHALNAVLLFALLRFTTGSVWRSSAVAALFAVHPLHVESVAWIAERKDVLSTFFWLLTMLGYAWYARRPSVARYSAMAFAFILGLMSKPMLVTLPFVLLLFDLWPLRRLAPGDPVPVGNGSGRPPSLPAGRPGVLWLVLEKVPLFVLAALSCVVTFLAQNAGGAVNSMASVSLGVRVSNALTAYGAYLLKMVWPAGLAVFYPLQRSIPLFHVAGSLALIACVTALAFLSLKKRPYLACGWLWYLGTLVPVIGLVQVGAQSMADRYTYVPLIGIFIMLVWGLAEAAGGSDRGKVLLGGSFAVVLALLAFLTWGQVRTWQDSVSLFTHAVRTTPKNYFSHNNLGCALFEKGDLAGAIHHFNEALSVYPEYGVAQANLGLAYELKGNRREAASHYLKAARIGSASSQSHYSIAKGLRSLGYVDESVKEYRKALELNPYQTRSWNDLGCILVSQGKVEEGEACFTEALKVDPLLAETRMNLAGALEKQGKTSEAISQINAGLKDDPGNRSLQAELSRLCSRKGKT